MLLRETPIQPIVPSTSTTMSTTVPVTMTADLTLHLVSNNDITKIPP